MDRRRFGPTNRQVPVVGQGTWYDESTDRATAVAALRLGLDLGMTHVDTAEMYGSAAAENVARRSPGDATRFPGLQGSASECLASGTIAACERSLAHLETDGSTATPALARPAPARGDFSGFEKLLREGKILSWGVSNFDVPDLEQAVRIAGEGRLVCNQVLYHLKEREIEHAVIPWCEEHGVAIVGYSPFGTATFPRAHEGRLGLAGDRRAHKATPRQVALRFSCDDPRSSRYPRPPVWITSPKTRGSQTSG